MSVLRALTLGNKIKSLRKQLDALREKDAEFTKREEDLTAAINEAAELEGDEAAEAQKAVEAEVEQFEADKKEHEDKKAGLESEIAELESDLAKEEAEQDTAPVAAEPKQEEREDKKVMITKRNRIFANIGVQERTAMFEREDVKAYLGEVRSCIKNKRELTNVGLTIPTVFIDVIKENIENYSKLYKHVNVKAINGKGREVVQGTIAEAIWTECCAVLNELSLGFNDVEVDCFKVAGFYKVCNAVLEDSDIDLAASLLEALSQAIGLAVDKAILYGRNSASTQKMPLGIVSRLAQTSEPSNYPATARPWVDLHTSNIVSLSAGLTGAALFKQIVLASAKAKGKYARGGKVWVMNENTYTKLMAETVSVNANGQIVTGVAGTMPVVGGVIEVLDFIPDNTIIGGYFDLYLLAERAGQKFAQSEHVQFIQDNTVFKGTARYDGQPVIAEAFVAIGLEATTPAANSVAFEPDTANVVKAIALSKNAVSVEVDATVAIDAVTMPIEAPITWTSSDTTKATVDANGVITGKASGSATITAVSGSASASVAVTVTT